MLLNQKAVRELALELAKQHKPFHPFERVGRSFIERIESRVRQVMIAEVKSLPSKGKTIL